MLRNRTSRRRAINDSNLSVVVATVLFDAYRLISAKISFFAASDSSRLAVILFASAEIKLL
ncbi:MAG TPA: hypothetical protein PLP21_03200 [Pyrinomonadaceae bacterium]|nr:hypothetical protein [Pyrinomonadaceae bacterium]